MKVIAKVPTTPEKRCVPDVIPWAWFFNRRPRGRR